MTVAYLSIASLIANCGLSLFVFSRKYSLRLLGPLFLLSVIIPVDIWLGFLILESLTVPFPGPQAFFFLYSLIPLALIAVLSAFVQDERVTIGKRRVRSNRLAASVAFAGAVCSFFAAPSVGITETGRAVIALDWTGIIVVSLHLGAATYALYLLENAYRYAEGYQRRIGRVSFLSAAAAILAMILTDAWVLLFRAVTELPLGVFAAVMTVSFPFALVGLVRYRLGSERIAVPREVAYSSYALLGVGALLVSLGIASALVRLFGLGLPFLWSFMVAFSLFFFALISLGSRQVRYRLSLFVDRRFYPVKYDYRKQFFGLHQALHAEETLENTLLQIIENLRASFAAEEAFLFIDSERHAGFHIVTPREFRYPGDLWLSAESPAVQKLRMGEPLADLMESPEPAGSALAALGAAVVFPVYAREELVGVLALRRRSDRALDYEDTELISAFAHSLGDAIFKDRILRRRLERKQFESFLHVSSFIVHDIKNQASTLALLMKNAEKNIGNPAFQKSLLRSLAGSVDNLQSLVTKLRSVPRTLELTVEKKPVNPIVEKVIDDSGLRQLESIRCDVALESRAAVSRDAEALYHVVKNLVNNALEAMHNGGALVVTTRDCSSVSGQFDGTIPELESLARNFGALITVEDTGVGMSRDFMQNRLFHPFATTKDKGVGIGLYQSKSLVEQMGGRIVCQSAEGKGTIFGILLR